jgi:polysaccharide pyruvyl transferase WcaK-like protein
LRVLTHGAQGGLNLGDELILARILAELRAAGHQVVAMSDDPSDTERRHGVEAVPRLDLRRGRITRLRALNAADALVIAGGEQVQEARWRSPFWGLLPTAAALIRAAGRVGVPSFVWAVGVRRIRSPVNRSLVRRWIGSAVMTTVRDHYSLGQLQGMGFDAARLRLVADPVFRQEPVEEEAARAFVQELAGTRGPVILLSPVRERGVGLGYLRPLLEAARAVACRRGGKVLVHLMDPRADQDTRLYELPELAPDAWLARVRPDGVPLDQIARLHAGSDLIVSARLHPLILAATQGVPAINLARTAKMEALAADVPGPAVGLGAVEAGTLAPLMERLLDRPRPELRDELAPSLAGLRERAGLTERLFQRSVVDAAPLP